MLLPVSHSLGDYVATAFGLFGAVLTGRAANWALRGKSIRVPYVDVGVVDPVAPVQSGWESRVWGVMFACFTVLFLVFLVHIWI